MKPTWPGYVICLARDDAEVLEGNLSEAGGILVGRRMTEEERRNGLQTAGPGPLIDITPTREDDDQ